MFKWAWLRLRLLFLVGFLYMGCVPLEPAVGLSASRLPLGEMPAGSRGLQLVSSRPIGSHGDFAYLGEDGNIWLFEMENFATQPLTQEGNYRLLRWSKDGQKIAAVRKGQESPDWIVPEVDELWVISVDRREKHKAVLFSAVPGNFPLGIINLEWVENDRSILFSVSFTRGPVHAFYRVGADEREVIINFDHGYDDCACRLNEPAFGEADYFSDIDFFRVSGTGRLVGTRIDVDNDFVAHWRIVSGLSDFSRLATLSNGCQGNSRNPSWSPDESTIAYTCDGVSINLLNVATGQDQVIYHHDAVAGPGSWDSVLLHTDWSSDGNQIIFSVQSALNSAIAPPGGAIYVINADGTGAHLVTQGSWPYWRPEVPSYDEGFVAYLGLDHNIWLIDSSGVEAKQVTTDATRFGDLDRFVSYNNPQWSPDGSMLAFERSDREPPHQSLWVYHMVDETLQRLLSDETLHRFDWMPDSSGLVFSRNVDHEYWITGEAEHIQRNGLWLVDISSGHVSEIISPESNKPMVWPTWSPDGRYLSFQEADFNEGSGLFALFDTETGTITRWGESIGSYDWSPNSEQVVYDNVVYVERGLGIWQANISDMSRTRLTTAASSISHSSPKYSPNGDRIVFRVEQYTGLPGEGERYLFLMNADGSNPRRLTDLNRVTSYSWSSDGRQLVVDNRESIFVVNVDNEQAKWIADGRMSTWQPKLVSHTPSDIQIWLDRKARLIPQMESLNIPTNLFTMPALAAYDETEARILVSKIEELHHHGQLTGEQYEAFVRLTLQEEALAAMLFPYTSVASTVADVMGDSAKLLMSFLNTTRSVLEQCEVGASICEQTQRVMERSVWRLLSSTGRLIINAAGEDAQLRQTMGTSWQLTIGLVEQQLAEGVLLSELLIDTTIQAVGTYYLVQPYISQTQLLLDKGVVTADPDSNDNRRLPITGNQERAELHIESHILQVEVEKEAALRRHQDFREAANVLEVAEQVSDLLLLSPAAPIAAATGLGARVQHAVLNLSNILLNLDALNCIGYLGVRSAELAFDSDQPVETCYQRTGQESSVAGQIAAVSFQPATVHPLSFELRTRVDEYRASVGVLIQAVNTADMETIETILEQLDRSAISLEDLLDTIQAISIAQNGLDQQVLDLHNQSSKFTTDHLLLHLALLDEFITQEDGVQSEIAFASTVATVLETIEEIEKQTNGLSISSLPETALLITGEIYTEVIDEQRLRVGFEVANMGRSPAHHILLLVVAAEEQLATELIEQLPSGGVVELAMTVDLPSERFFTVQIWDQDILVDSRAFSVPLSPNVDEDSEVRQSGLTDTMSVVESSEGAADQPSGINQVLIALATVVLLMAFVIGAFIWQRRW